MGTLTNDAFNLRVATFCPFIEPVRKYESQENYTVQ
jgi:hypothetical protein